MGSSSCSIGQSLSVKKGASSNIRQKACHKDNNKVIARPLFAPKPSLNSILWLPPFSVCLALFVMFSVKENVQACKRIQKHCKCHNIQQKAFIFSQLYLYIASIEPSEGYNQSNEKRMLYFYQIYYLSHSQRDYGIDIHISFTSGSHISGFSVLFSLHRTV